MDIGFVGLGNMGSGMAANLLKAGHRVTAYNRSQDKVDALAEQGARPARTIADACGGDAVVSMLANDDAVEAVTFGEGGILATLGDGAVHVSSSTISVELATRLSAAHAEAGQRFVAAGKKGVIVNNASVIGWRAQEGQAHYAAAKAGVMALTRCSAIDLAPHGIRVNAVSPSLAMHPFLAKVTSDELLAELKQREAFGRAAEPWEVANVMIMLASDYASYMTGEVVAVSSQQA